MNLRPSGYEPDELPDCSTPQQKRNCKGVFTPAQPLLKHQGIAADPCNEKGDLVAGIA